MNEKTREMVDAFSVTLELSVKDINILLNAINLPSQMPATTAAYFINEIQRQAKPQVDKVVASLEKVEEANKAEKVDES